MKIENEWASRFCFNVVDHIEMKGKKIKSDESSLVCDFSSLFCHRIKDSSTFDPLPSHCIDFLCCRSRIDDYVDFCRNDEEQEQLYAEGKIWHTGTWIHWLNLKFYSIEKLKTNELISNSIIKIIFDYQIVDTLTKLECKRKVKIITFDFQYSFFLLCFPLNNKRK